MEGVHKETERLNKMREELIKPHDKAMKDSETRIKWLRWVALGVLALLTGGGVMAGKKAIDAKGRNSASCVVPNPPPAEQWPWSIMSGLWKAGLSPRKTHTSLREQNPGSIMSRLWVEIDKKVTDAGITFSEWRWLDGKEKTSVAAILTCGKKDLEEESLSYSLHNAKGTRTGGGTLLNAALKRDDEQLVVVTVNSGISVEEDETRKVTITLVDPEKN
jgi:hypothetical protein